ncbi:NAD(P)H-binding protein [Microlunatus sp. Y2014]|uniref:NAD(P)H-binding protein n=1 Tax=Microlunatus sp. Y2014 TaxID=3418488 RepID=UPI003DA6EB2E
MARIGDRGQGTAHTVLVTGATGYVGGRLVPELLAAGYRVRVLARHPERITDRPWADAVEVSGGDINDVEALTEALRGVSVAYYLIHSMGAGPRFGELDRRAAQSFAEIADAQGVGRIVYLGGLHPEGELSPHLSSRVEVGEILLASPVPTVVLNAAMIIGSGSASFEMLRHLTERLPVMVGPRWLNNRIQPIAIRDVLHHLLGAADVDPSINRPFDIGGPEVVTYRGMMQRYAPGGGLGPSADPDASGAHPVAGQSVDRARDTSACIDRQAVGAVPVARSRGR